MGRNNREDEIDRLVSDIQFDRWIFGFPRFFTLVSHGHMDHDPFRGCMSFPEPIIFGWKFRERFAEVARETVRGKLPDHFSLSEGDFVSVARIRVRCLGRGSVMRLTGIEIDRLHADWWVLSTKKFLILFVGELDGPELPILAKILNEASNIDAVILPSYGGMSRQHHRLTDPDQLRREVGKTAKREREKGRLVYALPHPISPEWADKVGWRV